MALGWFYGGTCYAVQQQAIDTYFQAIPPQILNSSTNTIVTLYSKQINGSWNFLKQTVSSTGSVTSNFSISVTNPNIATCTLANDPLTNFLDGQELGWGVAGAMIVAVLVRNLWRR